MKKIQLTQGKIALVDDEDFDDLNQYKWFAVKSRNTFYAERHIPFNHSKKIKMHRYIMQTPDGLEVDHKDHNGLNCQKDNMRNCTNRQNQMNRQLYRHSTSGYKGVSWQKTCGKWMAYIWLNNKQKNLGRFVLIEDAAHAYNEAAKEFFRDFACLNTIGE